MAMGFSGSNGGVGQEKSFLADSSLEDRPLEVSYFINNECNLSCKHCYVGYDNPEDELDIEEWESLFDELIDIGALTFGNVGKEPLLSWDKTIAILKYLQEKRTENPKIRFGIVTNATLLDEKKIRELSEVRPDYVDVSVDGTEEIHDQIRGLGNYIRTYDNLCQAGKIAPDLLDKIFISYTLMHLNKDCIPQTIHNFHNIGINNFLISPFVKGNSCNENLEIQDKEVADIYKKIKNGEIKTPNIEILLKSDYDTQKSLMDLLVNQSIIDVNNLLIDEYGVIFNRYDNKETNSEVLLNFIPIPETFSRAIRISHDGYISGCYEMFFEDYPTRAKANIKEQGIKEILSI